MPLRRCAPCIHAKWVSATVAWYWYATPFLFNVATVVLFFLIGEESDGGHRIKRALYIGIKRLWLAPTQQHSWIYTCKCFNTPEPSQQRQHQLVSIPILRHDLIMLTCMAYNFRHMFFACTMSRRGYVIWCSNMGFRLDMRKDKSPLWPYSDITWATMSIKSPATRLLVQQFTQQQKTTNLPTTVTLWEEPPVLWRHHGVLHDMKN